jgi:DAACS family dicarboxylate/amino acid:cation (Na+ or H+) symporter
VKFAGRAGILRQLSNLTEGISMASELPPDKSHSGMPLHTKILIGLIVGITAGLAAHSLGVVQKGAAGDSNWNGLADWLDTVIYWAEPVGKVFLRMMFMVVVPMVFSALALAVVDIGDLRKLGRMGLKTLGFTAILSSSAVLIGVGLVDIMRPGHSLSIEQRQKLLDQYASGATDKVNKAKEAKPVRDTLVDLLPENPLQEMVGAVDGSSKGNGMLAVMVFSLICGIAITSKPEETRTFVGVLRGMYEISMTVIGFAMKLAPYGAGCLVFALAAQLGLDILKTLMWFVITALLGLGLQLFVVYSIVVMVFARMSPWKFFSNVSEAMLVGFGTSSSSATLPTAIKVANDELKLPPRVSNFVLTVGATGNQNGTALYEGVVVLFLAQVMGVDLTAGQQFTVVLMAILAGVGTAGVPGGSLPLIVVVMQSVGVPGAAIGIILGVDRILDMCRTVVNVTGDLAIAACVATSEPADPPVVHEVANSLKVARTPACVSHDFSTSKQSHHARRVYSCRFRTGDAGRDRPGFGSGSAVRQMVCRRANRGRDGISCHDTRHVCERRATFRTHCLSARFQRRRLHVLYELQQSQGRRTRW